MTEAPAHSTNDWQFDHLTLLAAPGDTGVCGLAALLGLEPGRRPAFPFGGNWFYQDETPLLHVIDAAVNGGATFDHLAFRSHRPLDTVLPAVTASGLPYRVMRIPETDTAQIFVQIAEKFVVELDVPVGTAGSTAADYSPPQPE
ncbi:hypothetical protein [Accumulibacter sp.]|uniref:hypothetical protein n=1 Tax=Accumulibacter sp. TaxID=2053492 RepID=UPI0026353A45|nr:hypothetical protein [Accumulibacter sp.]